MTKSMSVSKRMVYNSYLKVVANRGSAGIDKESIEMFDADLSNNLYKIWNRMASGSYFPSPVRTVFIPKKRDGLRALGIPTVSDRIAQGVVKDYLEPLMEAIFHRHSYGYRPGRSAHNALHRCQDNCTKHAWVIDVDIKGFFDNINHEKMMQLLEKHTQEKWVLLYIERWLKAGVEQEDGSIVARTKGTPQGGVISPLLANIYLHYCFDKWMYENNYYCPFERYADDIIIHCNTEEQAKQILTNLNYRMAEYDLELHPEKSSLVYCKNYFRNEKHESNSFTFLGYSFQPRTIRDMYGKKKCFVIFGAAVSQHTKADIRAKLKECFHVKWNLVPLEWFASKLNPKIRGWVNYYSKFRRQEVLRVFRYLNRLIYEWIKHTYKIIGVWKVLAKYQMILAADPDLFYHWTLGIKQIR